MPTPALEVPAAVLAVLACLAVVAFGLTGAGDPAAAMTGARATTVAPRTDRTVRDPRLDESSGLTTSPQHRGVLWTHEDSGGEAVLHALAPDGRTAARLTVRGAPARDWEALQSVRDPVTGRRLLVVADIGDNRAARRFVELVLVAEPSRLRTARVDPLVTLRLTYPDGAQDAEALLADPRDGRLYLVTKNVLGSRVYVVPPSVWPGRTGAGGTSRREARLVHRADVPLPLVTDGGVLADGRGILRTYGTLALLPPVRAWRGAVRPIAVASLPRQEQGESLAVLGGQAGVLIGSEGARQPILWVPLPAPGGATAAPSPSTPIPSASTSGTSPRATAAPSTGASTGSGGPPGTGGSLRRTVAWIVLGTLGLGMLSAALLAGGLHRGSFERRPRPTGANGGAAGAGGPGWGRLGGSRHHRPDDR